MLKQISKKAEKRKALESEVIELWNENFVPGVTQITALAESIAKKKKTSLSTVRRILSNVFGDKLKNLNKVEA